MLLTGIRIDKNGQVQLSGKGGSYSQAEEIAVKLNQSPRFTNASTERMGMQQGGVGFRIKCSLRGKARGRAR